MRVDDIPRSFKLTATELRLLAELADAPDRSAYGPTGLGTDAPAARRKLINRGLVGPIAPIADGDDANGPRFRWKNGGTITAAGVALVDQARRQGWPGAAGDDQLELLEKRHAAVLEEWDDGGPDKPDAVCEDLADRIHAFLAAAAAVPATGIRGLAAKARLIRHHETGGVVDDVLMCSLWDDIGRLASYTGQVPEQGGSNG